MNVTRTRTVPVGRSSASPGIRMRILVLGYLVRGPMGGMAWHHLQYVLGLAKLGHDVYFLEDSDDYASCYDPARGVIDTNPEYGLRFAAKTFERVGLADRWAYYDAHLDQWHGPCYERIHQICRDADALLNVSGVNPLRSWLMEVPVRVLIDTDPVFTQVRHLTDNTAYCLARKHTAFFSFGENIETEARIPDDGFPWYPTRQPIVLDAWPVTPPSAQAPFTTVMQWDSYPAREYAGKRYGMKSDSFGAFLDLPMCTGEVFELAVGSPSTPHRLLVSKGWHLRNPLEVTRDPWAYQRYIQQSKGEFSAAKHGYIVGNTGWFSERTAAYLASGRPVVIQDTGFSRIFHANHGLFAITSAEGAVDAVRRISADLQQHSVAARSLAEEYFASDKVLTRLLNGAVERSCLT